MPKAASTVNLDWKWRHVSEERRRIDDVIDFAIRLDRRGALQDGDLLTLRFPLDPELSCDPVFAMVAAIALRIDQADSLSGVELGVGSRGRLYSVTRIPAGTVGHQVAAWRFLSKSERPHIDLRLHLKPIEGPIDIHVGHLFAGFDFDPYIYNPDFEYHAFRNGRPTIDDEAVKADFTERAIAASEHHTFYGSQSFTKPFTVVREGEKPFPMLVGSLNSIFWYARDIEHDLESSFSEQHVATGDVVLDCGAHAGQMSTFFARAVGPTGRVYAFDPFPQNCLQVEAQAMLNKLDNLTVIQAAIGADHFKTTVSNLSQTLAKADTKKPIADPIEVDVIPLDDYIGVHPTFVKLDIEGAEVAALRGAQKLMRAMRPKIFIEVHTTMLPDHGTSLQELFELIPSDIYDIEYTREDMAGVHKYKAGAEVDIKRPIIVMAWPKMVTRLPVLSSRRRRCIKARRTPDSYDPRQGIPRVHHQIPKSGI